jgi:glycosyltransferase involved in cell wall biosynthesis
MNDLGRQASPGVSVIIPAYNQAAYVAQSVQSVLAQTYTDFELVVVDDGSTDDTPQVLAAIHDTRLRVIRQPNAGLSAARNTGLRNSYAPLVSFLDSDDYFLTDKLEVLAGYLHTHADTGLVAGGVNYVNTQGETLLSRIKAPAVFGLPALLLDNPICVSGIVMRREWIDRVGVFDETFRACEDWDLWLRLMAEGCCFDWVEHPVVAYRVHVGQMTRQSERMRKAMLGMLDKFFAQPGLPDNLLLYRNQAYAAAHVKAAAYAYYADEFDAAQQDLSEAVRLDPSLAANEYQRLVDALVSWSHDPRSTEPQAFLQRVLDHPPRSMPGLRRPLQRALADVLLGQLFVSSSQVRRARRADLGRVIRYKPRWLLNRGVLSMLARVWLFE